MDERYQIMDHLSAFAGIPDTVPEVRVCQTREELALWFLQFARAARAARTHREGEAA